MTLKNLTDKIAKLAIEQKCINYSCAGTSLYQINPKEVDAYPVLFQAPSGDHQVNDNSTTYEISLYYFDRLTEDYGNDIDVYSASIEQLKHIVKGIGTIDGVLKVETGYTITNFAETESFDDSIAGSFTTIRIETKNNEICYSGE